ncbi:ImcF-related family protein, partial [Paraburkholderia saeva]|uniref:ImcF-related family protein n=1 Tax=Paraburkholderia saeva TaxID=2777537 RepID=UPI001E565300
MSIGYWLVVSAITVIAAISAANLGDTIYPSATVRVLVVLLAGAMLLAIEGLIRAASRWAIRAEKSKDPKRYARDAAARIGAHSAPDQATTASWVNLKESLRAELGRRWRYGRPWLLLRGDQKLIDEPYAKNGDAGWCITDDAVVLWGPPSNDGQPDVGWLRQLAKIRRGRPLDAIVVLVDEDSYTQNQGLSDLPDYQVGRIADVLKWAAPVYVVNVDSIITARADNETVIGCEFSGGSNQASMAVALDELRVRLADAGVWRLCEDNRNNYQADLSRYLDRRVAPLADLIARLGRNRSRWLQVRGVFFTPRIFARTRADKDSFVRANHRLWRYIGDASKSASGRRIGLHRVTVISTVALVAIGLWSAGMLMSGLNNAHEVMLTKESLQMLDRASDTPSRLRGLLGLQQRIALHETRAQEHTPLLTRFGLNHDRAVLDALWTPYARAARPLLVAPVQQEIEGQLVDLGQMSTAQIDNQSSQMAQEGQQALKTYLMMAEPQRAEAAFMTPQLEHHWNLDTGLRPGEKLDLSAQLMGFWAQHFPAHPDWRIRRREDLVGNARQTLLAIIGVKNSEDTIYQSILDSAGHKYSDQTLASLTAGTDTRGLFSTSATVPGVFTRQAWEGSIEAAI